MQKKILSLTLCVVLLVVCVVGMAACNKNEDDTTDAPSTFVMPVGSRPAYDSLFTAEDLDLIDRVVADGDEADYFDKQNAVMALFDTANKSRIETQKSLVVQESLANAKGVAAALNANILMHSFNLRNGEKWYYQLATTVDTGEAVGNSLITEFAGYLKVGYCLGTDDDGDGETDYYYYGDIGAEYNCDCSVTTFPYAKFTFPKGLKPFEKSMTLEQFNDKLNVLHEIHEINNMDFTASIIGEDAKITYKDGVYRAEFSVDMEASQELLEKWFAMPKKDMAVGGQELKYYNYYKATLEVWNNGYAKYFESSADREAGMGSGSPVDKYSYLWDEEEIVNLVCTDTAIAEFNENAADEDKIDSIDDCIAFYTNHDNFTFVAKKLGIFEIIGIVAGCIVAVIIAIVVTVEVLVKKGKLPKLAKRRADKKAKRLAKKNGGTDRENHADDNVRIITDGPVDGIMYGEDVVVTRSDEPIDVAFGYPPISVDKRDSDSDDETDE